MSVHEWQFDGLVGPTHNYAGLSYGNVAATSNANSVSNPKQAALQGLEKMRFVSSLGVKQAFLPPHLRPQLGWLRQLGFEGGDAHVIEKSYKTTPELLACVYSASNMWTANAATVTPSSDSGKVTFTPANMVSNFHRSIEAPFTTQMLSQIFADKAFFDVRDPLPMTDRFADEGAANHMRLSTGGGVEGFHVLVYGRAGSSLPKTKHFPARQTSDACRALTDIHSLGKGCYCLVEQASEAIDLGVFHNDVIAMSNGNMVIAHEHAFSSASQLKDAMAKAGDGQFVYHEIPADALSVTDAVQTYFFNCQFLTVGDHMEIVAPIECQEHDRARAQFDALIAAENPITQVHYLDVRESMRNGGGPACLRLRVSLTEEETAAMHQGVVFTEERYAQLKDWVNTYYRDRLGFDDLRDPEFAREVRGAMEALAAIIQLPTLYD